MNHEPIPNHHRVGCPTESVDWKQVHAALVRMQKSRARLDGELGEWLLRALRSEVHQALGFASFSEYVERLFGEKPRWTRERLRVAEALGQLPLVRRGLDEGSLNWSKVRELTRVATPATEAEWLNVAEQGTARQFEQLVAGRQLGDRPTDPTHLHSKTHVLRFEISGDVLATVREAMTKLRREANLSEEEALLTMARQVLAGPSEPGRSSYQIAITICEQCRRGFQEGAGERIEVGREIVEAAECDCQRIGAFDHAPAARPTTHVGRPRCERASQSIPPRIRREVMRRDAGRCVVPGCRHARYVDIHHLKPRSEGGGHDPERLVVLCGAHHRALHNGRLLVEGSASNGLTFRHADGSMYGRVESPVTAETYQKTFLALRGMGFRETEVRRALDQVRREARVHNVESAVRRGLSMLAA